ncbi:MAG: oxygen-independent coproporphyrinogen III oxidase [Truepera sp.]|nr:oxygen-independent coproporphyrinogen III oxidase [Truepera sp.]
MALAPPVVDAALLHRYDRPGPRYTSYPTALEFHSGVNEAAYLTALRQIADDEALSLYTHLPFCRARCLYCACNVVISPRPEIAEPYLTRLTREIRLVIQQLGEGKRVQQLHFGGGTPTYFTPQQLKQLMAVYRELFAFTDDAEIAVEVDPRVTSAAHLEVLAEEGFNRLSVGVQDFDPQVQAAIARQQPFAATQALLAEARRVGFNSINCDLIYGLPYQTPPSFARTIAQVIALKPERLAIYSFAYVPWLQPHQLRLPPEALPQGQAKLELLATARERLLAAGYQDIGMDHFALPGDELALAQRQGRLARNFMGYTTAKATALLGFGLSAIGALVGGFFQNHKKLSRYNRSLDEGRLPIERGYLLSQDDIIRGHAIREWMCNFKVDKGELTRRYGVRFDDYFAEEQDALAQLDGEGFVTNTPEALTATPLGRLFPRNVAMVFDKYLRAKRSKPSFSRTV